MRDSVRLAAVQYQQRRLDSFQEFEEKVTYFVEVAADYGCDFVVFPEHLTLQLLSLEKERLGPERALARLSEYTPRLEDFFRRLSLAKKINLIAGSHLCLTESGRVQNLAMVCLRDGSLHHQAKIHPTPNERQAWNLSGGEQLAVIPSDCGPVGVLICYDSEFPELARHLVDQGAEILFVPFCTDERQGYLRVRYCCQARAVENQVYVAMSGNVGHLPGVYNMDIQYAQSCILTPCDLPFARDGIACEATPNAEMMVFAEVNLATLRQARQSGTVQNLRDRREDLYRLNWQPR